MVCLLTLQVPLCAFNASPQLLRRPSWVKQQSDMRREVLCCDCVQQCLNVKQPRHSESILYTSICHS